MNTPEKPITGQPPAPPVPQWLLDAADHFEQSYVRPRVSVRGLIYAVWIAGWEAGIDARTPTVHFDSEKEMDEYLDRVPLPCTPSQQEDGA